MPCHRMPYMASPPAKGLHFLLPEPYRSIPDGGHLVPVELRYIEPLVLAFDQILTSAAMVVSAPMGRDIRGDIRTF